jgi:hypothetical protein
MKQQLSLWNVINNSQLWYRVLLLSFPRARQFYRVESLHLPAHSVTLPCLGKGKTDTVYIASN